MHALPLTKLRQIWAEMWDFEPHARIGRAMLEKSLHFKTQNTLTPAQVFQLKNLVKQYKRNPKCFDETYILKPGTQLVRNWKGNQYNVLIKSDGFEYQGRLYSSLSKIANEITGSKWNGYLFFNLKKTHETKN